MLFVGTYEHTIDSKGRLAIPSDIRHQVGADGADSLYAVLQEGPTLCLYTPRGFEKRSEELDNSERPADEVLEYEKIFYSLAQRLEIDPQGRIRLPERLLRLAGLGRDVVLIGVKDHLELQDRQSWEQSVQEILERKPEMLMNPRRMMRSKEE